MVLLGLKRLSPPTGTEVGTFLPKLTQRQSWEAMCAGMFGNSTVTPQFKNGETQRGEETLSLVHVLTSCS